MAIHTQTHYPVFPLNTVFFPGCMMGLRIFEQRYLRMVSETSQADLPFVISLIQSNTIASEVGEASICYDTACLARISDFSQGSHGVLDLVVRAGARVKLKDSFYEKDNLMQAYLEDFSEPDIIELPERHQSLVKAFNVMKKQDPYLLKENGSMLSATELSFYLSHLMPISLNRKQTLLEMSDSELRLDTLQEIFRKLQFTLTA